jgi:hypothetical protein
MLLFGSDNRGGNCEEIVMGEVGDENVRCGEN